MLAIRYLPGLVTPALWARLGYGLLGAPPDADGRASVWLCADGELAGWMQELALAVCPDVPARCWHGVILQRYAHGGAVTPCHADHGHALGFILSLGATRTLRLHRVPEGAAGCGDRDLDVTSIECVEGTAVIMGARFHQHYHHQLIPSPDEVGERISLVFRTGPPAGG